MSYKVLTLEAIEDAYAAVEEVQARASSSTQPEPDSEHEGRSRFQRRQAIATESLQFDQKHELGVRPPRTLKELEQVHQQGGFLSKGMNFKHRAEAEMLCKEADNYTGHSSTELYCNALMYEVRCANYSDEEGGCCARTSITFSTKDLHWTVNHHAEHSEACQCKTRAQKHDHSITPYTYLDLARISALQEAVNDDITAPASEIKTILKDYIRLDLRSNKIFNLRRQLQRQLIGSAADAARHLPEFMAALRDDGHDCDVTMVDKDSMQALIMKQRRARFDRQQKKLPADQKRRWDEVCQAEAESVKELLQEDPPDTKYVVGWHIVLRSGKTMLPFLVPVMQTDATFMRSLLGGALYCTVLEDANNSLAPLAISWFWGGEGTMGWSTHTSAFAQYVPDGTRAIIDGTDAGIAAWLRVLAGKGKLFKCSVHFERTIKNDRQKRFYQQALKAPTQALFDKFRATITDAEYQALTQSNAEGSLFMLHCGQLFGFHCQNGAESLNNVLQDARKQRNHVGKRCTVSHPYLHASTAANSLTCPHVHRMYIRSHMHMGMQVCTHTHTYSHIRTYIHT